jgi:hypothetical protein
MNSRLKHGTMNELISLDLEKLARGFVVIVRDGSFHFAARVEAQHFQAAAIIDSVELPELLTPHCRQEHRRT